MPLRLSTVSVKKTYRGACFQETEARAKDTLVVTYPLHSEPSEAVLNGYYPGAMQPEQDGVRLPKHALEVE